MAQPWELESSRRPGRVRDWCDTWWAAALCVHEQRALCDSPDPAELRMVLKCTGTLILHSSTFVAWGVAGLPTNTTPPQAKWVFPALAAGRRTVRLKKGRKDKQHEVRHIEGLSSNKCIGPQYWGVAQTGARSLRSSLPARSTFQ